mgnify:CR=1 FL=1
MPDIELDAIDRRILKAIQANARMRNVDLAEAVGLSASPCLRRVKRLEDAGVIRDYVTLVDQQAVGLPVSIFINVTLERQVEKVMECYLMTGDADYLLRVVTADLSAYERFLMDRLTRVTGVAAIKSSFSLKQVVYRTALPVAV